ncbi:hypothetical protein CDAR_71921 [Caerostris darwini]|uniref:Uncharacterized protein n=1 Tax=Caerostris darwini TaxID=1538125 RepID=A0AAV4U8Q2_9ARAC|nr:hypothetical protein CDAR_71921 [Caerostris darwini]
MIIIYVECQLNMWVCAESFSMDRLLSNRTATTTLCCLRETGNLIAPSSSKRQTTSEIRLTHADVLGYSFANTYINMIEIGQASGYTLHLNSEFNNAGSY